MSHFLKLIIQTTYVDFKLVSPPFFIFWTFVIIVSFSPKLSKHCFVQRKIRLLIEVLWISHYEDSKKLSLQQLSNYNYLMRKISHSHRSLIEKCRSLKRNWISFFKLSQQFSNIWGFLGKIRKENYNLGFEAVKWKCFWQKCIFAGEVDSKGSDVKNLLKILYQRIDKWFQW